MKRAAPPKIGTKPRKKRLSAASADAGTAGEEVVDAQGPVLPEQDGVTLGQVDAENVQRRRENEEGEEPDLKPGPLALQPRS